MRRMHDYFAGLGGASEAFILSDEWKVERFDNNQDLDFVENMKIVDIVEIARNVEQLAIEPGTLDFAWFSPPCLHFSRGYNSPPQIAKREGIDFMPDLEPLNACLQIIEYLEPSMWAIENVSGANDIFSEIIGHRPQIITPYYIWGNIPHIVLPEGYKPPSKVKMSGNSYLASNKRAKLPLEVSRSILEAVEQPTLGAFI